MDIGIGKASIISITSIEILSVNPSLIKSIKRIMLSIFWRPNVLSRLCKFMIKKKRNIMSKGIYSFDIYSNYPTSIINTKVYVNAFIVRVCNPLTHNLRNTFWWYLTNKIICVLNSIYGRRGRRRRCLLACNIRM